MAFATSVAVYFQTLCLEHAQGKSAVNQTPRGWHETVRDARTEKILSGPAIILAAERIAHAEKAGLDTAWIAQHHFHEREGGLPAPFAFLGFVAARTSRSRSGTGIVTLPLENPVRVAEDAAILDLLANGRFERMWARPTTSSSPCVLKARYSTRPIWSSRSIRSIRRIL